MTGEAPSHVEPVLTIIGGKGGVGRSTVAAGVALFHARQGRRVVAIDVVGDGGLAKAFGQLRSVTAPAKGSEPTVISVEGHEISLLGLSTEASLQEYLQRYVPLPNRLLTTTALSPLTAVFDFVAKAAPAVAEILTIGKIGFEATEGEWDSVVVDGPATGHIVDLVTAPAALTDIVQTGPLVAQAGWLDELMRNPKASTMLLVATPEELPVTELMELKAQLEDREGPAVSGLVVNRVPPKLSADGKQRANQLLKMGSKLTPAIGVVIAQDEVAARQFKRLQSIKLPLISVADALVPFRAVADAMGSHRSAKAQP